jgi:uncharacterized glyoxalase superfamily protein PhnB
MLACMKRIVPGIIVKDTEAAKDFYIRHLAAKVIFDAGWYISLRLGGRDGPELPGSLSLYVEVDDVDAVHDQVRGTGAVLEGPPSDKPWGDRSFTLTDPHGVRVYVFSPRPMSPEFAPYVKE